MKLFADLRNDKELERNPGIMHDIKRHERPAPPLSPHEKRSMMQIEFDDDDWPYLLEIFGDEDSASAAVHTIMKAPPEIQILAVQLMSLIKGGC